MRVKEFSYVPCCYYYYLFMKIYAVILACSFNIKLILFLFKENILIFITRSLKHTYIHYNPSLFSPKKKKQKDILFLVIKEKKKNIMSVSHSHILNFCLKNSVYLLNQPPQSSAQHPRTGRSRRQAYHRPWEHRPDTSWQ